MKASEYIKEHGDFEITEVEKCILHKPETVLDLEVQDVSNEDIREVQEVKCMKKSDLVAGKHVVKYQNGGFRFVGKNGDLKVDESKVVSSLMFYNARLEHTGTDDNDYDIVAVYELNEVWKREEPTMTITEDEKAILRNLPAEYKWITRDEDSKLYIYQDKPEKSANAWENKRTFRSLDLFNHLFKVVKWEDDEPWKIDDLLKLDVKKDG